MKNNKKKLVLAVLTAALFTTAIPVYASTSESEQGWIETTKDSYSIIVDDFSATPNYAGAYIKDDFLYISTTDVSASKTFLSTLSAEENLSIEDIANVKFNEVEYTYDELMETSDYFIEHSDSLSVVGTYTDPETNNVVVETSGIATYALGTNLGFDNVVINYVGETDIKEDSTYLRGGYAISDTTQGKRFSLGCGIKWNATGEYGFLTAAHDTVQLGDVFKYSGTQFGTVVSAQNSGSIDAALIKRTDTSFLPSNKNGTDGIVCTKSGTAIVGDTLTLYGSTTGSSQGRIEAVDYTTPSGLTNIIKSTCESASGDSGGALIATRSTGNVFVGINKGRVTTSNGTVYEIGTKWTEIRDTYNVVRLSATES